MFRFATALLISCVAITTSLGCGGSQPYPVGDVSGTLTLRGKPAPGDLEIFFMSQQTGAAYKATIQADGSFEVEEPVRVGEYVAYVQPAVDLNLDMSAPPKPVSVNSAVPKKYSNDSQSDLVAKVQEGENDFKFDMK